MTKHITPKACFLLCNLAGLGLLFMLWMSNGVQTGFFLLLFIAVMTLLRWRVPKAKASVWLDVVACILVSFVWPQASFALAWVLFQAMFLGIYPAAIAHLFLFYALEPSLAVIVILGAVCGLFLGLWKRERDNRLKLRDTQMGKYYQLEDAQNDQRMALSQVERLTAVAERARIARDIHDNAGHEIVAAYMSFQTARMMLEAENADAIELYDAALQRLDNGAQKMRQAVHNLANVTFVGVESLQERCAQFPGCPVQFQVHGNTSIVPIYVWNILEAILSESLTNIARHSQATKVQVSLDATPYIIRLCVENDGVQKNKKEQGRGLQNLRQRATAIGGSLSVDAGEKFRVICVIPIKENNDETVNC